MHTFSDNKYLTKPNILLSSKLMTWRKQHRLLDSNMAIITSKVLAVQVTHFQICPFCNTKIQSDLVITDASPKYSVCSLTLLNTQLQNSMFSKFVIQQKDDSFLNYITRESVVNTFLVSLINAPLTSPVK